MSSRAIEGVIPAMVTPFAVDGSVDLEAAGALARRLVDGGAHGIVVAATSGESPTLGDAEAIALLEAVLDAVGEGATVICGTGSNDTAHSVSLTAAAADAGAHGALVVTPYYNKPSEAGLRAHFAAVAGAAEIPIVLYNIPSRSALNMPPALLAEIAAASENVVAVKQANNEELGPIDGLALLAGNDEIFLRTLELGGAGGILVSANLVPERVRAVYDAATAGEGELARQLDGELHDLYEAMGVATNPIPIKAALELAGVISGRMRLPMMPADGAQRERIHAVLEHRGLLAAGAGTP